MVVALRFPCETLWSTHHPDSSSLGRHKALWNATLRYVKDQPLHWVKRFLVRFEDVKTALWVRVVSSLNKLSGKIAQTWRSVFSLRIFAIVFCVTVLVVLAGPFGTLTNMSAIERVLLWVPLIAMSVVMGWLSNLVAQVVLENRHAVAIEAFSVVLMTALFAPCVWLVTTWINADALAAAGGAVRLVFYVFVVVAAVSVIRQSILAWVIETEPGAPLEHPEPRLLQRLPKSLRAPVLRLSAKDHMVEVVTQAGTAEVRLRLSDAVSEMDPVEGFMAHRSHWVAKHAVTEAQKRDAGKMYLKLSNGDLVPVSRTFRPDWMKSGLLNPCLAASNADAASAPPSEPARSEPQSSPRA